ncbi:polysaccharide biosynthesis tyrosine autokinase [Microbacterium esteraromaticum]|uniref:Polysaccharide biosynthesis tyrosine autokinase n=1 Tax=Microbacterium esteraromaticum TaxID=57043 RepID=A0A7D8ABV2_9MICO|nr:polysaccharide biosynthesis tyrosine autokinase [Microbacterium esteraromaticum]QMU97421.1 polysaccharide biosynthesis tyrosine autokinase [Microbacterium esteraromaticum]
MDLHDLIRMVRRQVVLILAAALVGTSVGAITALLTPQRFEATAQMLISVDVADTATAGEFAQAGSYAVQVAESYRILLTSSGVLQPVIDDLGLDTTPDALAPSVRSRLAPNGVLISATVSDANPGQAARIANAVADSFRTMITEQLERRDAAASYRVDIVPVQAATVPRSAAAPNLGLSIALGAAIGLAAGVALAFLRTMLDRRIRTLDDVEDALESPLLGGIPFDAQASDRPLIMVDAPREPRAEAYRSLRTNVRFLFPENGSAVFVVSSSRQGEGKSTVAANLALAFGEAGYRAALIDADLRRPRVATLFGIEGAIGLSDVLIGRIGVQDAMVRWGRNRMFVMPAGTIPPNPAELLGSGAMERLLDDLRAAFDVVILDAPPVLPVTDAAVLTRLATGVLLVAAAESTTLDDLASAAQRFTGTERVLGSVVTKVPTRGADRTAYGDYAYGTLAGV